MDSHDTEDRSFEQEIALSEADYRLLVEQVQAAVFVIQQGRFLFVNPKLLELFGYTKEEMLQGMDPMLLCVPEHRDMVRAQASARVAGVPGNAYELDCVRKNGERFKSGGCESSLPGRWPTLSPCTTSPPSERPPAMRSNAPSYFATQRSWHASALLK
jgi:PAS domain S-box-containing protein